MNKRILFIGNSQGTAAGLTSTQSRANYPSLIADQNLELECHYWLVSDNSVMLANNLFSEMIVQCQPDLVILQCGIIEAGLRILPKRLRNLLGALPGGGIITNYLHKHRSYWIKAMNRLSCKFVETDLKEFSHHLESICQQCQQRGYKLILVLIPLLSDACEKTRLPDNNQVLNHYNQILTKCAQKNNLSLVDPFTGNTDSSRNSLYIDDTVHFSTLGHQLIAHNLIPEIKKLINYNYAR